MKPTSATPRAKSPKRFSLVPPEAQQEMYRALLALKAVHARTLSGAEVTEIAVCLAAGMESPVILAAPAIGASKVRKGSKPISAKQHRLAAAASAAVTSLLDNTDSSAVILCAGRLDTHAEGQQDFRRAVSFAARYKLPILFLVSNTLTPGKAQEMDLRTLYAEFGIPVFSVDASDAIAAYRVATEALHNARHMRGPCVIESLTVRRGVSPCPVELLAGYMERHGTPLP